MKPGPGPPAGSITPRDAPARAAGARDDPFLLLLAVGAIPGALIAATLAARPYANPDGRAFEALAQSLLAGHGLVYREPLMPSLDLFAFRSPGYAGFLAGALAVGGVRGALALQGALAGATAALLGSSAARLAGRRAGLLTFAAFLSLPLVWRFAGEFMSETLYAFLVALAFRLALHAGLAPRAETGSHPRARIATAVGLGIALAAALLTRPHGIGLVVALTAGLALRAPLVAWTALAVAFIAWLPWPVRNALALRAFVPALTSGGINAWAANTGHTVRDGWQIQTREWQRGEVGLDRMFWRMMWEETRAHPLEVAVRIARKAGTYLAPPTLRSGQVAYLMLWPLAWLAALFIWRQMPDWRWGLSLAGLVWLAHALLAALVSASERYRFPTDGLVLLAGILSIEALIARHGLAAGAARAIAIALVGATLTTLARFVG